MGLTTESSTKNEKCWTVHYHSINEQRLFGWKSFIRFIFVIKCNLLWIHWKNIAENMYARVSTLSNYSNYIIAKWNWILHLNFEGEKNTHAHTPMIAQECKSENSTRVHPTNTFAGIHFTKACMRCWQVENVCNARSKHFKEHSALAIILFCNLGRICGIFWQNGYRLSFAP